MNNKPRVVKDYEKLDPEIQKQLKYVYPYGFSESLISYTDQHGLKHSALPFETDEKYYLIRMTASEAIQIIDYDDDFDSSGELKDEVRGEYREKFSDLEYLNMDDVDEDDQFAEHEQDDIEEMTS